MTNDHAGPRLGLVMLPVDAKETVDLIVRAERAGVESVWLEMNAIGLDPFPLLAAATTRTERIGLGTAILPAFGRHPAALATQVLALEGLAPGRLRLGVGTGNALRMTRAYGHPPNRPLARLREYLQVLRPILHWGEVSFEGEYYTADVHVPDPPGTPVLLSAIGPRAYNLAGEIADGALSWLCPIEHLHDVAKPALERGAALAGRTTPPLIAHVSVALDAGGAPSREAIRHDLARYARVPVFGRMFAAAGYPTEGGVSDSLLDALVIRGDAGVVAARLASLLDRGIDEVMVSRIPDTPDRAQDDALLAVLGSLRGNPAFRRPPP
jgi:5,10-methylenetetrahydromethanopterin reductase